MNNDETEVKTNGQAVEVQTDQGQETSNKITFTDDQQEAINKLVAEKIAEERRKAQQKLDQANAEKEAEVKKAAERAKMSAEERAKAEAEDRRKKLEADKAELVKMKRELSTKSMLMDKGISADMLPLIMGKDDEETQQNLALLDNYVKAETQKAVNKLMAGHHTGIGNTGNGTQVTGDNPWSKQAWNLTKQQQIIASNPEQAQQMIAQAQPTGYYIH